MSHPPSIHDINFRSESKTCCLGVISEKSFMINPPKINPGDWITVGHIDCVVAIIYPENASSGICKVIHNKKKPTTRDVSWDGEKWFFPERPDFGGYGKISDPYVQKLMRGKHA